MDCDLTINEHCLTSEGASLLEYWRELRAIGPVQKSDLSPHKLRPWLGSIGIVQRERDPLCHRVRLVGSNIALHIGLNRTGKTVEEYCPPSAFQEIMAPYYLAYKTGQPVLSRMASTQPDSDFSWLDRMLLPVAPHDPAFDALFYVWMAIDSSAAASDTAAFENVYSINDTPVERHTALALSA